MESLIPVVIGLVEQLLPVLGASSSIQAAAPLVAKIINGLIVAAPFIRQEFTDLKPRVLAVIAALKADPATNAKQIEVLEQLEVGLDAEFDEAAAAALAEDAEAAAKS